MNLFTTSIDKKRIDMTEDEENEVKGKQKIKKRISLSFFQAPTLYLEHLRRNRANSFKVFLNSIYESPGHFPKWKLVSENFWPSISVRMDLLEARYLEFCTKEGLKPKPIEEETEILRDFNLSIDWKIDTSTDAYTHVRWKTPLEKFEEIQLKKSSDEGKDIGLLKGEQENVISKFLNAECAKSSFKRDFILISELKERYDDFCSDRKIDDLVKINIVGCPELEQFGARFDTNLYIPYINGITLMKIPVLKNSSFTPGIIRIPKESKARKRQTGSLKKLRNKLMNFLFSSEGVITNLLVVIIHFILLVGVPLLIFIAVTWSLIQINTINSDIHAVVFNFFDIFYPSTYDFWLNDLSGILIFYVLSGLCGMFFLSGLLELLSFYATGPRDTGKYIVQKSWIKWFTTILFWVFLLLFIGIYTAYISVILVWCILGAVLNPQKFLPMAVGAVVIIVFAILLYTQIKNVNKGLEKMVGDSVDTELKMSLMETMRKEHAKNMLLQNPPIEDNTRAQFYRALNSYMVKNNYPPVDRGTTDSILDGNMGACINMMYRNCGIDNNIGLGLIGWLKQDPGILIDSVMKIAAELGQDISLNATLAEISLDTYNPDSVGVNQAQGTIILSLKKLFRKSFPQFPIEMLDGLLQIVSEGDPRPLESILKKLDIPSPLFQMSIGFVMNNDELIQKSIKALTGHIFPQHYKDMFDSWYTIFKGNPKAGLFDLAEKVNVPHEFLIQFIVAVSKQDNSLIRYVLSTSVDQIFDAVREQGVNIPEDNAKMLKNYLLAIYTLSRGSEFNIVRLVKENIPKIDPYLANIFYRVSKGSIKKFDRVIDSLGLMPQKKAITEFCHLLFEKECNPVEIGGRLGVHNANAEVLEAIIKFVVTASKYYIKVRPKLEKLKTINKGKRHDERTQMTEAILDISTNLKKYLYIMYYNKVIEPEVEGFSGRIMKIGSFVKELFYDFTGEVEYTENARYKHLDISVRKEEILVSSTFIIQKILKGDQSVVEKITSQVLEFLEFKTEKKNYFKALCTLITSFVVDVSTKNIEEDTNYDMSFKMVSMLLDIDEEHLEFILDVFSGNPYRIFKCYTSTPHVDIEKVEITAEFHQPRLGMIADVLE